MHDGLALHVCQLQPIATAVLQCPASAKAKAYNNTESAGAYLGLNSVHTLRVGPDCFNTVCLPADMQTVMLAE